MDPNDQDAVPHASRNSGERSMVPTSDEEDPMLIVVNTIRAWRIARVLRPYVDKFHPGYIHSLHIEMSQRVWIAVGSDARFMRKLHALRDSRDFATMVGMIVKYERRVLKRISREIVRTKLRAEAETGFVRFLRFANRGITSLISGKVG